MSPRFDRRKDQRQGSGAGQPARSGGRFSDRPAGRGGGRPAPRSGARPFRPRGEWSPEGEERRERRERPDAGERRPRFERRPEGSSGPERRSGRPQGRPQGRRFEAPSGGRSPYRAPGRELRRDDRRDDRRDERRDDWRDERRERPQGRSPIAVDVPSGEAERFNAAPADDLIWGRHAAQAALESDRPIHRIWCTPEMRFQPRFLQLLREAKAGGVLVEEVTWARLGQLTDGAVHQGIVLQAAAADTLDLGTLVDGCKALGEPPLLMALDGITDPHNLGAIVRSAEALGAHGLVLPQRRSAGLTGSVAKVAAGALEHLPVARVVNLNRALDTLKQEGYRVIGLAGEGSVSLSDADLDGPLVIVTGSEGSGLSMLTRKHCDQLVRIPLRGATPSLNASVATAMVLYEVARRGWMKQISGTAPAPRIVRPQMPAPPAIQASPAPDLLTENVAAESGLPEFESEAVDAAVLPFSADEQERAEQIVADVIAELSENVEESTEDSSLTLGLSSEPRTTFSADIQL